MVRNDIRIRYMYYSYGCIKKCTLSNPWYQILCSVVRPYISKVTSNHISSDGCLSCWFMNECFVITLPSFRKFGKWTPPFSGSWDRPRIVMFCSTYLCKAAFSTLFLIKNKYRNRMDVENDMRCALSETPQGLEKLLLHP